MKSLLYIILSAFILIGCSKSDQKQPSIEPEKSISVEKVKFDLPYLDELQEQKDRLNEKIEFWTARTLFTDASEEILDLDLDTNGTRVLYITKNKQNYFIYILETNTNASPRLICKETKPLSWVKFYENDKIIYSITNQNGTSILHQRDLNQSIDQLPKQIQQVPNGEISSSHISSTHDLALSVISPDKTSSTITLIKDGLSYKVLSKAYSPAWSNDGKKLLFVSKLFGQPEIVIWEKSVSGIQRFSISSGENQFPRFSPNGEWVIFNAKKDNSNNIYIRNCRSTFSTRISRMKDMNFSHPSWGPDGKIYAIGNKNNHHYIFQFQTESKMFQVNTQGEPGPMLDTSTPVKLAEKEIRDSL